jgi:hypothetical protein
MRISTVSPKYSREASPLNILTSTTSANFLTFDHIYFLLKVEGKAETVEYLCGNEISFLQQSYLSGALSKAFMIMQLIINKTQ